MSEEIINKIRELIDKGIGDSERLHTMLNSHQNGDQIELSDKQYVESLSLEINESEKNENPTSFDDPHLDTKTKTNSNNNPETDKLTVKPQKSNRKKIVIAGIVIAVILSSYIGANTYAVSSLQFRPHQGNQYAISDTVLHIQADVCNPSYFPASFHNYEIDAIYQSKLLETASINGSTISPKSALLLDGTFTIDKQALLEFGKLGSDFNETQAVVKTKLYAPIFGVIPFTIHKDYSAKEFADIGKKMPVGGYQC